MTISKPLQISALWARVSAKLLSGVQSPKEVQGLGNLLNDDKVCGRSEERPKKTLSSEASWNFYTTFRDKYTQSAVSQSLLSYNTKTKTATNIVLQIATYNRDQMNCPPPPIHTNSIWSQNSKRSYIVWLGYKLIITVQISDKFIIVQTNVNRAYL